MNPLAGTQFPRDFAKIGLHCLRIPAHSHRTPNLSACRRSSEHWRHPRLIGIRQETTKKTAMQFCVSLSPLLQPEKSHTYSRSDGHRTELAKSTSQRYWNQKIRL